MSESVIASIDQGTSSTRVLIISKKGEVLGSHQMEHKQHYPKSGHVEHDPLEIWKSVKTCLCGALSQVKGAKVEAIGITNQRETTVVWNKKTGKPYHNAIVWNDNRTGSICDKLSEDFGVDRFREKTGLPIAPYFSATKLLYLLDTVPNLRQDAKNGDALFGTIDTWIIWRLTNGAVHATDVSNASRTMFMDLKTLRWDEEILTELNIPRAMLPSICPSSHIFGKVSTEAKLAELESQDDLSFFEKYHNVPIAGVLGDQNAALFGQACFHAGDSKCTYGTGAFMLFNTGAEILQSKHGLLTTVAYQLGEGQGGAGEGSGAVYALEGSVAYSGSVVQWLRDNLGFISSAQECEALARTVPDNGGVYFVPAFAGLFAPYWRSDARGVITGLTAFNTKAHIVRAALEASAFQTVEVSNAMQLDSQHRMPLTTLRVDGGMTANGLLMQFLSDLLDVPLVRPKVSETTALGAAFVAGLAVGVWKDTEELKDLWQADAVYKPAMSAEERKVLMASWKKALDRSLGWVEHDGPSHPPLNKNKDREKDSLPSSTDDGKSSGGASSSGGGSSGGAVTGGVVAGRVRALSNSTPLGTTGVPSASTAEVPHILGGAGSVGAVRHLATPAVTAPALHTTPSVSTAVPIKAVRRSTSQKLVLGVAVGVAVGFGYMVGVEAFKELRKK